MTTIVIYCIIEPAQIVRSVCDMIIDVLKMKQEGLDSAEYNFDYDAPNDLIISLPNAQFKGAVKVNAYIELDGKDVYAEVNLDYTIAGECSRCLESATANVHHEYTAKYSLTQQEDCYLYKSGKVDLTSSINEAIIVNQPTVIYCKEDCKGLCLVCGANLNDGDCGHGNGHN